MDVYESISYDMADIFAAAYREYEPAQSELRSKSIEDIRELVRERARDARNYDPHEVVHGVQQFVSRLNKLIRDFLVAIIFFGTLTGGAGLWVSRSRALLDALGSVTQTLISVILSGPTAFGMLAGVVLLYSRLLAFNTFVIQTLNRQLVIDGGDLRTREDDELAGYLVWNSSLNGGAGYKLIAIFSALWILSALIPRRDPYTYFTNVVENNIGIFGESDGLIDAISRTIPRVRAHIASDDESTVAISDE